MKQTYFKSVRPLTTLALIFALSILTTQLSFAQSIPPIHWQKTFGGTNNDEAYSVIQTAENGYAVAGLTFSNDGDVSGNHGGADFWVMKLDSSGQLLWQKALGGTSNDYAHSLIQAVDGGYAVAGEAGSNNGDVVGNHGGFDFWVVKLSSTGQLEWQKTLGGTSGDGAYSLIQTTDGGYAVAGLTVSNNGDVSGNHGNSDFWVVKLSSTGQLEWQKTLGGTGNDYAQSLIQTAEGGYAVAGYTHSTDGDVSGNHGGEDFWVVKLDSSGELEWQKTLGGTGDDAAYSLIQTTEGGYAVAGNTHSTDGDVSGNHGLRDFWVVKLSSTGQLEWQKTLGGTNYDEVYSLIQTTEGEYSVAGVTLSNDGDVSGNHGEGDFWIVELNSSGQLQLQKTLGGAYYEKAQTLIQTADGGTAVAGLSYSIDGDVSGNHGRSDFWVVKLGATSTITATVGANGSIFPSGYVVLNNGGNPTFTFAPNSGYHIDSVIVDGVKVDSTTSYTFNNVTSNHTIRAVFAINAYTLTVNAENGSVTKNPEQTNYNYGTEVILTAIPATNFHFVNWSGDLEGIENPDTLTMDVDKTVTADFAINTYTLTTNAGANGNISPSGTVNVNYGSNQQFTFAPDVGYYVDSVLVDGVLVDSSSSYTFINVTSAHTIRVKFAVTKYYRTFALSTDLGGKPAKLNKKGKSALLPKIANWRDTTIVRTGGKSGITLGIPQSDKNLAKTLGWILYKKGADFGKFYTQIDTDRTFNAPFDIVRKSGANKKKRFVKALSPNIKAYTNPLAQAFGLFKLNLYSSIKGVTPTGLDSLVYVSDGSPYNGMPLSQIANRIDTVLTYHKTKTLPGVDTAKVGAAALETLRNILNSVNEAFDTTIALANGDSINASGALKFAGLIGINRVSFLTHSPGAKAAQLVFFSNVGNVPEEFSLQQNYPNPFNPQTVIGFSLLAVGNVSLKIYNVLGQEVATLLNNEAMDEGEHEIQFDASSLSSGVYFYRLLVSEEGKQIFTETKKLVLMK